MHVPGQEWRNTGVHKHTIRAAVMRAVYAPRENPKRNI
jgi:hypothetical protein